MRFTPLSEKELAEMNQIPDGYYRYKVLESKDKKSQAGADMIELKVEVYVDGRGRWVFDYLLEAMMHKINHFCKVNEMMDKYDNGTLTSTDCFGRNKGYVQIGIQKDKTGKYGDKSVIKDYVSEMPEPKNEKPVSFGNHEAPPPGFDDDVPSFL